jgi:hypothetical protein
MRSPCALSAYSPSIACTAGITATTEQECRAKKPPAAVSEKAMTRSFRFASGETPGRVDNARRITGGSKILHDAGRLRKRSMSVWARRDKGSLAERDGFQKAAADFSALSHSRRANGGHDRGTTNE